MFLKMLGFKTICILKLYTVLKMYTGFEKCIRFFEKCIQFLNITLRFFENDVILKPEVEMKWRHFKTGSGIVHNLPLHNY